MSSPYDDERAHLVPLLEAFQEHGNTPVAQWFIPADPGWSVYMRRNLDARLIEQHLSTDIEAHHVTFGNDELHCTHCQVTVYGADAG